MLSTLWTTLLQVLASTLCHCPRVEVVQTDLSQNGTTLFHWDCMVIFKEEPLRWLGNLSLKWHYRDLDMDWASMFRVWFSWTILCHCPWGKAGVTVLSHNGITIFRWDCMMMLKEEESSWRFWLCHRLEDHACCPHLVWWVWWTSLSDWLGLTELW